MFPSRRIVTSGRGVPEGGYSLNFNGTSDYLTLPINFEDQSMTVYAWVKLTAEQNLPHPNTNYSKAIVFDNRDAYNDGIAMTFSAFDSVKVLFNSNFESNGIAHNDINEFGHSGDIDKWELHSFSFNGTADTNTADLFRNGSEVDDLDEEDDITISLSGSEATIGKSNLSNSTYLEGRIYEVAIYNIAHAAFQHAQIYRNGDTPTDHANNGGYSNYLCAWYRMGNGDENGSGTTIYDMSGNGHDATMSTSMGDNSYIHDNPWNI